ncbi:hypothetical protein FOA52_011987 [Chlamydomonas sp. UWO 241]|nr:hypothetical protein FOA52_011987 [Chlamydomonas sp. UWO 241]
MKGVSSACCIGGGPSRSQQAPYTVLDSAWAAPTGGVTPPHPSFANQPKMSKLVSDALRLVWRRVDNFLTAGINPDPIDLWKFRSKADLSKWRVFTDAAFGGGSHAALDLSEDGKAAVFSGRYSKALGDGGHLVRSGYCGINYVRKSNINLCMHDYLDFRVRGDGHTYIASVRSDQLTGGDEEAWQAPLPTAANGEWQTVRVDFEDLIFTFRGRLVQASGSVGSVPRERVMCVGVTMAASDDMPDAGDFRLELDSIVAGAYEATGVEGRRKIFRGDIAVAPDPMWDRRPADGGVSGGVWGIGDTSGGVLGGRGLRRGGGDGASSSSSSGGSVSSGSSSGGSGSSRGFSTSSCTAPDACGSEAAEEEEGAGGSSGSRGGFRASVLPSLAWWLHAPPRPPTKEA